MENTQMFREIMQEESVIRSCITNNTQHIRIIAEAIKQFKPTSVVFSARGTSCNATKFGKYLFETYVGLPCSIAAPSIVTQYKSNYDLNKALVIGISQSGAGEDICSIIKRGNASGAMTIAITNTEGSLISNLAQGKIYCYAGEEIAVAATKTFTSQLLVLLMMVAFLTGDQSLNSALLTVPQASEAGCSMLHRVKEILPSYREMDKCVVLARGVEYPIALETALKLQETSYIFSHGFAISDFTHGPVAIMDKSSNAIILLIEEQMCLETMNMLARVKKAGASVLLVTCFKEIAQSVDCQTIILPDWCSGIPGVFASISVMQLFACGLSVIKGENPDAPKGLKKVTITM